MSRTHLTPFQLITGTGACLLAAVFASVPTHAGNYIEHSDAFEQWSTFRATRVVANAGTAPDGSSTADQVFDSTTENGARIYSNSVVANGGSYVFSCYLKAGTLNQAKLTISDGSGSSVRAYIQPTLAGDWQRYTVSVARTVAGESLRVELYPGKYDKENGYIWAWGAQLESGTAPTVYTPEQTGSGSAADTTAPAVPSGLSAQLSGNGVQVQWSANSETDLAGYRLQRSVNGSSFADLAQPQTPGYVDNAVTAGSTYQYRVAAVDSSGNASAYSPAVSIQLATPVEDVVAEPVTDATPTPGVNLIQYPEEFEKWGSFREARAVANAGPAPDAAPSADQVVDSLTQNGAYLFSNTIVADGGAYTLSCYLRAGTLNKAKLALFDAATGSVRCFIEPTLTADWQRYTTSINTSPSGSLLRVGIYAGKFDKESGYVWAWGAQLEHGTTATSYSGSGSGNDAPVDTVAPAVPSGLSAGVSGGSVQVQWNANTEADFAVYRLQRSLDSANFSPLTEPRTTSYLDSSVSPGTKYYYRVAAVDATGNVSAFSSPVSVAVPLPADTSAPSVPTGIAATAVAGTIQLRWNANSESDLAGYRLDRGVNSTNSFSTLASPTTAAYTDSAVQAGNSYSFRVCAVDRMGNVSAPSTVVTATIPLPTPSGALNVVNFGANPATGGDDAGPLQAAFDAAAAQNKDVYLPAGHYAISRTVVFRAPGRMVYGDGMTRTIVAGNTNSYNLLQFDRIRGAGVRDLRFEGSVLNDDKINVNRAVDCYATVGTLIQRVHSYGAGYIAFDNGGSGTVLEDCVIEDYGRIGYLANDNAIVRRCRFVCRDSWNFTGEMHGIYAPAGRSNILIEDNEFINVGSYAIQLWGSQTGVWTENVTIQRNTFVRCKNVFVVGAGSSGPSYRSVRFLANTIRQSQDKDIRIMKFNGSTASGTELLIEGNVFEDPAASYGFMVINNGGAPITGVRVRNNQFLCPNRSSYQGILHFQQSEGVLSDIVVEGNLFQNFGHSGTSEKSFPAIWIRSGSAFRIQDNTFVHWSKAGYGSDVDGVRFEPAAQGVSITRNVFQGTGLSRCYGVRVTAAGSSASGSITGNQFQRARLLANGVPESGNTMQ